jgi:hypothetical protein
MALPVGSSWATDKEAETNQERLRGIVFALNHERSEAQSEAIENAYLSEDLES